MSVIRLVLSKNEVEAKEKKLKEISAKIFNLEYQNRINSGLVECLRAEKVKIEESLKFRGWR